MCNTLDRIYLEDCLTGLQRISNDSIDAIITDPPYGIAKKRPLIGRSHGTISTIASSWDIFDSSDDFVAFTTLWLTQCQRILKPNGSIAVWGDRKNIFYVQPIMESLFGKFLDLITWVKRDAPPNISQRGLAASTEFCLVYCKGTSHWTFNGGDLKKYNNGKQARNYLDISRTMTKSEKLAHPTQKKLETQAFLVEMMSHQGECVLDPFMGSGTVAEAAVRTGRHFIGFESNADYHAICRERLAALGVAI